MHLIALQGSNRELPKNGNEWHNIRLEGVQRSTRNLVHLYLPLLSGMGTYLLLGTAQICSIHYCRYIKICFIAHCITLCILVLQAMVCSDPSVRPSASSLVSHPVICPVAEKTKVSRW